MPKYTQPKNNAFTMLLGLVVLLAIIGSLIYFISGTPFLLSIIPIIAFFLYFENKRTKKKFALLAEERKELGICEFARSFDTKKIDTWVVRAVYEQLQTYVAEIYATEIPIQAEDSLFDLLEIDEEDLDFDLLEEIAQRTGRSLENIENNKYFGKVTEVKGLVYLFNEQPIIKKT